MSKAPQQNAAQVAIDGLQTQAERDAEEREEELEIEAGVLWRTALWSAMRTFVAGYIGKNKAKGYDAVAAELDKRWGPPPHGRPVSSSVLRACLHDSERNNFRAEWLDWFAARSPEVADLMAKRVRPEKTDRQLLEDFIVELAEDLSHKRIQAALRRARVR